MKVGDSILSDDYNRDLKERYVIERDKFNELLNFEHEGLKGNFKIYEGRWGGGFEIILADKIVAEGYMGNSIINFRSGLDYYLKYLLSERLDMVYKQKKIKDDILKELMI